MQFDEFLCIFWSGFVLKHFKKNNIFLYTNNDYSYTFAMGYL